MIMSIDEAAFDASLSRWKEYVVAKAKALKLDVAGVLKKEAGRLVLTLIKITPPGSRAQLKERIAKNISATFMTLSEFQAGRFNETSVKSGQGDVVWYAWQSDALYGVKGEMDKTQSSGEEIENIYFSLEYHKGILRQMAGMHGKQKVWIKQKILVSKAAIVALTKKFQKHIGRQKAAWLPSYRALGSPTGMAVPGFVTDHESNARGYAINDLTNPNEPSFTLENHAVGIGHEKTTDQIDAAFKIRADAMVKRTAQILEHPELVGQESDLIE